jgi:hypothetical protein
VVSLAITLTRGFVVPLAPCHGTISQATVCPIPGCWVLWSSKAVATVLGSAAPYFGLNQPWNGPVLVPAVPSVLTALNLLQPGRSASKSKKLEDATSNPCFRPRHFTSLPWCDARGYTFLFEPINALSLTALSLKRWEQRARVRSHLVVLRRRQPLDQPPTKTKIGCCHQPQLCGALVPTCGCQFLCPTCQDNCGRTRRCPHLCHVSERLWQPRTRGAVSQLLSLLPDRSRPG